MKQIMKALAYIEEHIDEPMSLQEIAKIACYSPHHFHRLFHYVVGETVHQYIKRLRLAKAAQKLRYTKKSITDIALDACFETPSSFARAFAQWKGRSPREYRIVEQAIIKKLEKIEMIEPLGYETIDKLSLHFVRCTGDYDTSAKEAWERLFALLEEKKVNLDSVRLFSIAHDDPEVTNEAHLRFDACVENELEAEGEVGVQKVQGRYATFEHVGSYDKIGDTADQIALGWLPQSGESYDEARRVLCEHLNIDAPPEKRVTKLFFPLK